MRFRENIVRLGQLIAYEISRVLPYETKIIETPLSKAEVLQREDPLVICSVLRAGLPLHNGILNTFDDAESAFISASRIKKNQEIHIETQYAACPDLTNKILILADPMIATGKSLITCLERLNTHGRPKSIHIASVIGSEQGVGFICKRVPENTHLWIAAIDPDLNEKKYIVPGLGDAGELAFGKKL